jgi:very-short-patch-repair endonuclease
VIRFWNNEVIENIDGVLMETLNTARSAKPLSHGERGLG